MRYVGVGVIAYLVAGVALLLLFVMFPIPYAPGLIGLLSLVAVIIAIWLYRSNVKKKEKAQIKLTTQELEAREYDLLFSGKGPSSIPSTPVERDPHPQAYRISPKCPSCRKDNPREAIHCMECGNSLPRVICPKCEIENPPEAVFCMSCGERR